MKARFSLALAALLACGLLAALGVGVASSANQTQATTVTTTATAPAKPVPVVKAISHSCLLPGEWWPQTPDPSATVSMSGVGNVTVTGALCQRKGLNLNLIAMLYAPAAGNYYNAGPATIALGGAWSVTVYGIGAADDPIGSMYGVVVMGVSNGCLAAINAAAPTNSGVPLTAPPKGCTLWDWYNRAVIPVRRDS